MKAEKIQLEVVKKDHDDKNLPVITSALPFFKSRQSNAKYYHRVRSMSNHKLKGRKMHTSVSMWCGYHGFLGEGRGQLHGEVPEGGVRCAVCEGKAIGAGVDGARIINGKRVKYSPREIKDEV